jgi:Ca2+-binding RTX toxin-like protein
VVMGGYEKDEITTGAGHDIGTGDSGHAIFNAAGILTYITTISPETGDVDTIKVGAGNNVFLGGIGADSITSLGGRDILVGDNGNATFDDTGVLLNIKTSNATAAGSYNDVILGGGGDNVIFGGNGDDSITTLEGNDVIVGDNGEAKFDSTGGVGIIREIISTDTGIGGVDTILAGEGNNIILGGLDEDAITSGDGNDIGTGDSGHAIFNAAGILTYITTISPVLGSRDIITIGGGNNVFLGGNGADEITSLNGSDVLEGDNGFANFTDAGVLIYITTSSPAIGGNDVIYAGAGRNIVFGGIGSDTITTLGGEDTILGDNGFATFTTNGTMTLLDSTQPEIGGDDLISAGDGFNVVIAGNGTDVVRAGINVNLVIGDDGFVTFHPVTGVQTRATSTDPLYGNNDFIEVGSELDIIIGGVGSDTIIAGGAGSKNFVFGDGGFIRFDFTGMPSWIVTTHSGVGGNDRILLRGGGTNYVLGGVHMDFISIGDGESTVLGDEGEMFFDAGLRTLVETLNPGVGARDHIALSSGSNTVIGGAGSDLITTRNGTNLVFGDEAIFRYSGGSIASATRLNPQVAGNDVIRVGSGLNVVVGGSGSDDIQTGTGWHVVMGDNATLEWRGLYVSEASTVDHSVGGDDHIRVAGGDSLIFGGQGRDYISDGNGDSFIAGDNGYASLAAGIVRSMATKSFGTGGNDTIFAGAGADTIFGGTGNDFIDGGSADDTIVGDQARYDKTGGGPRGITLLDEQNGGNDVLKGGTGSDLIYGNAGNDTLEGGSGDDSLFASYGNDRIIGESGNDILVGGPGADFLDGGQGHDILFVDLFDVWVGGLPEDIIVGGPAETTGLFFGLRTDTLSLLGLSLNDGAAERFAKAAAADQQNVGFALINRDAPFKVYAFQLPSAVFAPSGSQIEHGTDAMQWGGLGASFAVYEFRVLGFPALVGIGSFLEAQWGMIILRVKP